MRCVFLAVIALSLSRNVVLAGPTNAPTLSPVREFAVAASGDKTNAPAGTTLKFDLSLAAATNTQTTVGQGLTAQTPVVSPDLEPMLATLPKSNEVVIAKLKLSGSLVEAVKIDQPLQLINPFAPARYGSPEDNVLRDASGKVTAWKLFSVHF